jgi:hypothetical protein
VSNRNATELGNLQFPEKKALKKYCGCGSIYGMGMIQLSGKKSSQIAKEYGVSSARARQYAKEHDLPYVSFDGGETVEFYLFDEKSEKAFANRPLESPGRPFVPKPPKVPRKPGRPRKEKPADTGPKRPVGRPRKEPLDIVKRARGRPKK